MYKRVIIGSGRGGSSTFFDLGCGINKDPRKDDFISEAGEVNVIESQVHVGAYRADFRLVRAAKELGWQKCVFSPPIIVELDGHDFHERTKEQAEKDKRRDRDMLAEGYQVVRFTGSEVWRNAHVCAEQIDELLDSLIDRKAKIIREAVHA